MQINIGHFVIPTPVCSLYNLHAMRISKLINAGHPVPILGDLAHEQNSPLTYLPSYFITSSIKTSEEYGESHNNSH